VPPLPVPGRELPLPFGIGRRREEGRAASDCGSGGVPGARLCALTSKPGMSFIFMGWMRSDTPSIKDSEFGLADDLDRWAQCIVTGHAARPIPKERGAAGRNRVRLALVAKVACNEAGKFKKAKGSQKCDRSNALSLAGTMLAPTALPVISGREVYYYSRAPS
jgi:hypothetical protein